MASSGSRFLASGSAGLNSLRRATAQLATLAVLLAWLVLPGNLAYAEDHRVAVVVPFTTAKSQKVFDDIVEGLGKVSGAELLRFDLGENKTAEDTRQWLEAQQPVAVVTIGKKAYEYAAAAKLDAPIVVGGMSTTPAGRSGVSMSGDPSEFFARVRAVTPEVKRVHIVFGEKQNGWWIEAARTAAAEHELELITHEATSTRSGAKSYKGLLKKSVKGKDAVWIPLTSVVSSRTVLPMVLKKAWDKYLVVFTNSPAHTKQGALFSLYPNNISMGEQLMRLALAQSAMDDATPRVELTQQMSSAFNWRTASHLGLKYSLEEGVDFDRVYPVQ